MTDLTRPIRRLLRRGDPAVEVVSDIAERPVAPVATGTPANDTISVDIPESDPLMAYLQTAPGPVELARLELDSPAVTALREAGVALVVDDGGRHAHGQIEQLLRRGTADDDVEIRSGGAERVDDLDLADRVPETVPGDVEEDRRHRTSDRRRFGGRNSSGATGGAARGSLRSARRSRERTRQRHPQHIVQRACRD